MCHMQTQYSQWRVIPLIIFRFPTEYGSSVCVFVLSTPMSTWNTEYAIFPHSGSAHLNNTMVFVQNAE